MSRDTGCELKAGPDHREAARRLGERHGVHAKDYALARIEASETAGEGGDAAEWRKVLDALDDSAGED